MMQFSVIIPDKCKTGETVRIHLEDGTEANVKVPSGLFSGDSFVFEIPMHQMQNPQKLAQSENTTTSNIDGSSNNNNNTNSRLKMTPATKMTINFDEEANTNDDDVDDRNGKPRTFFGCEIADYQDFVLALGILLLFVSSIVVGFLLGILHTTAPYAVDAIDDTFAVGDINNMIKSPAEAPELY